MLILMALAQRGAPLEEWLIRRVNTTRTTNPDVL